MANHIVGSVELTDANHDVTVKLDGNTGNVTLGGGGHDGDILMKDAAGHITVGINGETGAVHLGGNGEDGDLLVRASNNQTTIHLNGSGGNVVLGGGGFDGDLAVRDSAGVTTIALDGQTGQIRIRDWTLAVPDHVLAPEFPLRELAGVREHIDEYGHLPDVPSAGDLAEHGVDLTRFCMTLLQKVEELTLYVLAQDDRIAALEATDHGRPTA